MTVIHHASGVTYSCTVTLRAAAGASAEGETRPPWILQHSESQVHLTMDLALDSSWLPCIAFVPTTLRALVDL